MKCGRRIVSDILGKDREELNSEWANRMHDKFELAFKEIYDVEGDPKLTTKILKKYNISKTQWINWQRKTYR